MPKVFLVSNTESESEMFSDLQPNCARKNTHFFHMTRGTQTAEGYCFMNERKPNSPEHEDRSWWQRRKTRLQWPMRPSTQRIRKDIRGSSYFFTRRAADVFSEACFTAMTGDRHDELAAMDHRWPKLQLWDDHLAK